MRPRSAVHDDPDQVASLTADTIRVKLTDNQGGVSFETYVVNLANLNDNAPEFSAPVAGTGAALEAGGDGTTASPYQITGFDENLADGTTVFTPATTDADDVDGGVTDTVEYSLASGVADNDLFTIDAATGAVSFNAGEADYERPVGMTDGTYRVEVTATNADASPVPTATGATKPSSTQVVEIVLNNIDEAPTRIFLDDTVLSTDTLTSAPLMVDNPDEDNPVFVFTLVTDGAATDGEITDTALFTITNGALVFSGTDDQRKGVPYQVRVQVSDGALTTTQIVEVSEGSLFIDTGGDCHRHAPWCDPH